MSGGALRVVLGDQLSAGLSALADLDPARDTVLMMEVAQEATYVRHHKKKIILILAAMRHFADALRERGLAVRYVRLEDPENTGAFSSEVARAVRDLAPARIVCTEPGEYRVRQAMDRWAAALGVPVEIRADDRFLASVDDFAAWANGRKALRMEYFYREMRRRHALLMDGDAPAGGQWNLDQENRKRLPDDVVPPAPPRFAPDAVTEAVITLVEERFADHFGDARPFGLPVTAAQAEAAFEDFVDQRLSRFGDYQDAMVDGEETLFHSLISTSLNIGLLDPLAICRRAEHAYRDGRAPLNAVEGFIRQILGWREYVRGLYWLKMPGYADTNALEATRPLPAFFWTGETEMRCLAQAIGQTKREAYAHHIQRLMVTGNYALLAGIDPVAVNEWYMVVYADAFEWVELPNTHGMALFADGGVMASKPYAASGKYIDRMSDHCRNCRFDPKQSEGDRACPFNALYWDFLARNDHRLRGNPRLGMVYRTLDRMDADKVRRLRERATALLDGDTRERAA